jgi:hypothetical protein
MAAVLGVGFLLPDNVNENVGVPLADARLNGAIKLGFGFCGPPLGGPLGIPNGGNVNVSGPLLCCTLHDDEVEWAGDVATAADWRDSLAV